jgi:hypothetical protein
MVMPHTQVRGEDSLAKTQRDPTKSGTPVQQCPGISFACDINQSFSFLQRHFSLNFYDERPSGRERSAVCWLTFILIGTGKQIPRCARNDNLSPHDNLQKLVCRQVLEQPLADG